MATINGSSNTVLNASQYVMSTKNDATSSDLNFRKIRNTATVQNGDKLGQINFNGYDGANFILAAQITGTATSTIAANQIPGRLNFSTASSTGVITQRMIIDKNGMVTIGAPDTGTTNTELIGGDLLLDNGNIIATEATSGSTGYIQITNSNNTASSQSQFKATVAGGTAGDAFSTYTVTGVTDWSIGVDNSDSDRFKITPGTALGTSDAISISTSGVYGQTPAGAAQYVIIDSTGQLGSTPGAVLNMWIDVPAASQTIAVNNYYIADNAGLCTFTLPATASLGDVFWVAGGNAGGGWLIAQNANQALRIGSSTSTVGVGGSIASTASTDSVQFLCTVAGASTRWTAITSMGALAVV